MVHEPLTSRPDSSLGRLRLVLAAGIVLRFVVFLTHGPFTNDHHAGVITGLLASRRFPDIRAVPQAYHLPLYYVLAIPWLSMGGWKGVQAFQKSRCRMMPQRGVVPRRATCSRPPRKRRGYRECVSHADPRNQRSWSSGSCLPRPTGSLSRPTAARYIPVQRAHMLRLD